MDKFKNFIAANPALSLLSFVVFAVVAYEPLYWLVLNIWCGLYGLGDPYRFWG